MSHFSVVLLSIQALVFTTAVHARPKTAKPLANTWTWLASPSVANLTPSFETATSEQLLTEIISEPEHNRRHEMLVSIDEAHAVLGLIRRSGAQAQAYSLEEVNGGVVLAKAQNRNALYLSCEGCTATAGGTVTLKYLFNGLTNYYKDFKMILKNEDGQWSLYTNNLVRIQRLRLVARKIAGQLVGIRSIEVENEDN